MSPFTGALTVTSLDKHCLMWRLEQPLRYEVGHLGSGRCVVVPAGYVTDAASIPWPLRAVLPAWGRYSRAALVHDALYTALARGEPHPEAPTRKTADAIFHEALIISGVSAPLACLMWAAVRLFAAERAARR